MEKSNMGSKAYFVFIYFLIGVLRDRGILVFMIYETDMTLQPCTFNIYVCNIFYIFFIRNAFFSYSNILTKLLDKDFNFKYFFITFIDFKNEYD